MLGVGVDWMWNATACAELAKADPGAYDGLTVATIGVMLSRRGVPTSQMNRVSPGGGPGAKRQNLTGFTPADVQAARPGNGQQEAA